MAGVQYSTVLFKWKRIFWVLYCRQKCHTVDAQDKCLSVAEWRIIKAPFSVHQEYASYFRIDEEINMFSQNHDVKTEPFYVEDLILSVNTKT